VSTPRAPRRSKAADAQRVGRYRVALEQKPFGAAKRTLDKGLTAFNLAAAGPYRDSEFIVGVRDPKGELRGGFWVEVYYESAFLKWAWIDGKVRRKGMGRALMAMAEAEAKARGAVNLWLDTFSFQARPFYEKLGYKVFGTLAMGRPGVERYWLVKDL
jgi:GNAT superfamily N-acetyltransferase